MTVAQKSPTNGSAKLHPERILVADDEHLVATGLKTNLIELGYAVVGPASNGEQAIELARTAKPDMALLDIRMPRKTGIEAGEVISKQFGVPVIIISAFSDPEYIDACNAFDTYGFLLKPVSQSGLHAAIEVAWGRYCESLGQKEDINRLNTRLGDRKIIEQAKWMLVERRNIKEPEAMRMLQQQARNNRRTLVDVAKSLIESDSLLGDG